MKRLQDRVALISGSGRGIGRAITLKLASEGVRVLVHDLDLEVVQATTQDIIAQGGQAEILCGGVTDPAFGASFVKPPWQPSAPSISS